MTAFVPLSTQPVFYQGSAIVGAKITIFDAGTLTPRTAYKDGLANAQWAQPILSDANGTIPEIWVVGNPIKVRITTADGVLIREVDNIPGDVAAGGGGGGGGGTNIPPGFMMAAHLTGTIAEWVRANGRTLGNALSGAAERANADTVNLFTAMWNADTTLAVSGGRGASAAIDYAANKTIALPDYRGRIPVGLSDMGGSNSARLTGATFSSGNETTLGSPGGTATEALSLAQLAAHTHAGSTASSTDHQHIGTTATGGAHTPTASAAAVANHSHAGSTTNTSADHTHSTVSVGVAGLAGGGVAIPFPTGVTATGAAGAHSHTATVTPDGAHTPSITVDPVAAHDHAFTSNSAGAHLHSFVTAPSGSGTAHNNAAPFMMATIYLKL